MRDVSGLSVKATVGLCTSREDTGVLCLRTTWCGNTQPERKQIKGEVHCIYTFNTIYRLLTTWWKIWEMEILKLQKKKKKKMPGG